MHSSFHNRSPENGISSSSGYHYHPYNNRGFRGRRGFYRNRGGYQPHRHPSWKSQVTVKEEPLGDASLLARLDPAPDSLLNRVSPAKGSGPPETPTRQSSLAARISGRQREELDEGEIMEVDGAESIASSRNSSPNGKLARPPPTEANGLLAEQLIADALMQGKQLAEQTCEDQASRKSPESEAAVDDLLNDTQSNSSPPMPAHPLAEPNPATVGPPPSDSSRSASVDRATLVEQAKLLIAPLISRNARLRNPNVDPKVLEEHAMSLVTEEQCLEFLRLAKESQSQLKARKRGLSKAREGIDLGMVPGVEKLADFDGKEVKRNANDGEPSEEGEIDEDPLRAASSRVDEQSGTKRQPTLTTESPRSSGLSEGSRPTAQSAHDDGQSVGVMRRATPTSAGGTSSFPAGRTSVSKTPPTAPRSWRVGAASTPASLPRQATTVPSPSRANPGLIAEQGKSSLAADRLLPGNAAGERRTSIGSNSVGLDTTRPIRRLIKTASYAGSEDMDVDSSPPPTPKKLSPAPLQNSSLVATPASALTQRAVERRSANPRPPSHEQSQPSAPPDKNLDAIAPPFAHGPSEPLSDRSSSAKPAGLADGQSSSAIGASNNSVSTNLAGEAHTSSSLMVSDVQSSLPASVPASIESPNTRTEIIVSPPQPGSAENPTSVKSSRTQPNVLRNEDGAVAPTQEGGSELQDQPAAILADSEASMHADRATSHPRSSESEDPAEVQRNRNTQTDPNVDGSVHSASTPVPHTDPRPSTAPLSVPSNDQGVPSSASAALGSGQSLPAAEDIGAPPPDVAGADSRHSDLSTVAQDAPPMEVDTATPVPVPEEPVGTSVDLTFPNICFLELGRAHAAVNTVPFQVDPEAAAAAARWCQRGSTIDPTASYAVFHLLCLRASDVQDVVQNNPHGTAETLAAAFRDLRTQWPPRGQLIVEMNPDTSARGTWLPKRLGPDDGPLDVTAHIVPGTNTIRFVQLGGYTDRFFTLFVGRPDKRDETSLDGWENWANSVRNRS